MHNIFFLSSEKPLVKTYTKDNKVLQKESYPVSISKFTSTMESVDSIDDLYNVITKHAEQNSCMIKGILSKNLDNESRKGCTSSDDTTNWICLDFDKVTGFNNVQDALDQIGLGGISYVLQYSASHLIDRPKDELNCHVFMLLEQDIQAPALKQWLKFLNLNNDTLKDNMSLAKSNNALLWGLDITTCQNDKLIYIAPPVLKGLKDPCTQRIKLISKKHDKLNFVLPQNVGATETQEIKLLNEKRKELGFNARKTVYKTDSAVEYLHNPDKATITGKKTERNFVYFNLNGGDSWAYYHPVNNPTFIHNFKGEPVYKTEELLPDYWLELSQKQASGQITPGKPNYIVFRDPITATYYNAIYDPKTCTFPLLSRAASKTQLSDFLKQYGQPAPAFIPDIQLVFEPKNPVAYDMAGKRINKYVASEYFAFPMPKNPPTIKNVSQKCPTIIKVITHALGIDSDPLSLKPSSEDRQIYEHFLNWLSYIAQYGNSATTAWVLHGTQGTGKGVLYHKILAPLFLYTTAKRFEEMSSRFNAYMENKLIVFVDEVQTGHGQFYDRISASLKSYITEPHIQVNQKYIAEKATENRTNFIFASNSPTPVHITNDDRRFNVANFQTRPIKVTTKEIEELIPQELQQFAFFIRGTLVDTTKVRVALCTKSKQDIADRLSTTIQDCCEAIKTGDLTWFQQLRVADVDLIDPKHLGAYTRFERVLETFEQRAALRQPNISREEAVVCMVWACGDSVPTTAAKFSRMLSKYSITMQPVRIDGVLNRGIAMEWQEYDDFD